MQKSRGSGEQRTIEGLLTMARATQDKIVELSETGAALGDNINELDGTRVAAWNAVPAARRVAERGALHDSRQVTEAQDEIHELTEAREGIRENAIIDAGMEKLTAAWGALQRQAAQVDAGRQPGPSEGGVQ